MQLGEEIIVRRFVCKKGTEIGGLPLRLIFSLHNKHKQENNCANIVIKTIKDSRLIGKKWKKKILFDVNKKEH